MPVLTFADYMEDNLNLDHSNESSVMSNTLDYVLYIVQSDSNFETVGDILKFDGSGK